MQKKKEKTKAPVLNAAESRSVALKYMKTLVEVARESFLILDSNLKVISANPIFYKTFSVLKGETEQKLLFKLGDGQWNIPELKKLLKKVLPEKKDVKNFEVTHVFQKIGAKTMLLNASQIDSVQLIIIALEDITLRKQLEGKLAEHTKDLEMKITGSTKELLKRVRELEILNRTMIGREVKMVELKKEIVDLRKK